MPTIPLAGLPNIGTNLSLPNRSNAGSVAIGNALSDIGTKGVNISNNIAEMSAKADAANFVTKRVEQDQLKHQAFQDELSRRTDSDGKVRPMIDGQPNVFPSEYGITVDKETNAYELVQKHAEQLHSAAIKDSPNRYADAMYSASTGSYYRVSTLESQKNQFKMFAENTLNNQNASDTMTITKSGENARKDSRDGYDAWNKTFTDLSGRIKLKQNLKGTAYSEETFKETTKSLVRNSVTSFLQGTQDYISDFKVDPDNQKARIEATKELFKAGKNTPFFEQLDAKDFASANKLVAQYDDMFAQRMRVNGERDLQDIKAQIAQGTAPSDKALSLLSKELYHGFPGELASEKLAEVHYATNAYKVLSTLVEVAPSMQEAEAKKAINDQPDLASFKAVYPMSKEDEEIFDEGVRGAKTRGIYLSAAAGKIKELAKLRVEDSGKYAELTFAGRNALSGYMKSRDDVNAAVDPDARNRAMQLEAVAFKKYVATLKDMQENVIGSGSYQRPLSKEMTALINGDLNKAGQSYSVGQNLDGFNHLQNTMGADNFVSFLKQAKADKLPVNESYATAMYLDDNDSKAMVVGMEGKRAEIENSFKEIKGETKNSEVSLAVQNATKDITEFSSTNLSGLKDSFLLGNVNKTAELYIKGRVSGTLVPPGRPSTVDADAAGDEFSDMLKKNFEYVEAGSSKIIIPKSVGISGEEVKNFIGKTINSNIFSHNFIEEANIAYPPEFDTPELKLRFNRQVSNSKNIISTGEGLQLRYQAMSTSNHPDSGLYRPLLDKQSRQVVIPWSKIHEFVKTPTQDQSFLAGLIKSIPVDTIKMAADFKFSGSDMDIKPSKPGKNEVKPATMLATKETLKALHSPRNKPNKITTTDVGSSDVEKAIQREMSKPTVDYTKVVDPYSDFAGE